VGKYCYRISGAVFLRGGVLYVVRSSRAANTSAARRLVRVGQALGFRPIPSNRDMDWYAETWFLSSKLSPSREGGKTFPWHVPVAWPSVAVRGVRMAHAKKQRRKENREPECVMLGAEHLFS
jgi:hypothetical protein